MNAFWVVKHVNGILWAKMYAGDFAASRPVLNQREAKVAFAEFVADLPLLFTPAMNKCGYTVHVMKQGLWDAAPCGTMKMGRTSLDKPTTRRVK